MNPVGDAREDLANRICEQTNINRMILLGILADYEISFRQKSLIVYDGGETENLIKRFCVAKKVAGRTIRTCEQYHDTLGRIFRQIGKSPVQTTHMDIQKVIAQGMLDGDSKAYSQTKHRYLSSFFTWLIREEIIEKNPMVKVDSVKVPLPKKRAFTDMDVEKLRAACTNSMEIAIVEVLLSTGVRVSELTSITRDQINKESFEIIGKGEKPRTVYMNARAQLACQKYIKDRSDDNPYLFPGSVNAGADQKTFCAIREWYKQKALVHASRSIGNSAVESIVRDLGKKAGVENVHPHRFRRTCATLAHRRGMPIELIRLMLGHANLQTTQRYIDCTDEELEQAHKKFMS